MESVKLLSYSRQKNRFLNVFLKNREKWEDFNFEKEGNGPSMIFLESPPNCYTGVRIPTKIRKDIFAFFVSFGKVGLFWKVNQRFGNGFGDSV